MMRASRELTALSLLFFGTQTWAQSNGTTTLTVTSRLVVLDVRVFDAKGHPVTNLDRSQFSVFEDKEPQRIRNFEPPAGHPLPAAGRAIVDSTADLEKVKPPTVNILVVDELNTAFEDTARGKDAMRKFLMAQPDVLPVPTLLLASGSNSITVLHDFTQRRSELLASLKSHVTDVDGRMLSNVMAGGSASATEGFGKTLGALSMIASSVRGIPGHKNMIWIGAGFDKAYDLTTASDSDAQKISDAIQLVTARMMAARISLSTIDPNGVDALAPEENIEAETLAGGSISSESDLVQNASFDDLARSTGGTVVHGQNDLQKLIAEDVSEAGDFYTITYVPTGTSDAAVPYRSIRVVMKDPSLHAVTRTGYGEPSVSETPIVPSQPKTQTREFRFDLLSAGASRMVYTGLHLHAQPIPGGYNVQVETNDLDWRGLVDGTRVAEVSLVGVAFNSKDRVIGQVAQEYKERIRSTDNMNGTRVGFKVMLDVPSSASRVRFVVRDATSGSIGSEDLQGPAAKSK